MLKLQIILRDDQILLARGERTLRAHNLDRWHGSNFYLAFRIIQSFLRVSERFLLHADVLKRIHQVPIHVFNLIYRGNDL